MPCAPFWRAILTGRISPSPPNRERLSDGILTSLRSDDAARIRHPWHRRSHVVRGRCVCDRSLLRNDRRTERWPDDVRRLRRATVEPRAGRGADARLDVEWHGG